MMVVNWSKFSNDPSAQIPREHSKVHVLKKNRTLQQIIFSRISRYYIKTKDLFYQLIMLFF